MEIKHSQASLQELATVSQRTTNMAKEQMSHLVSIHILEKIGTGTGQAYILSQHVSEQLKDNFAYERNHELDEERVKLQLLSYMEKNQQMTRADIVQLTRWAPMKVYRFMLKLRDEGLVKSSGRGKGAYYYLANQQSDNL